MKPANLVKTLTSAQLSMKKVRDELKVMEFEGTAGGGLVKLTINGQGKAVAAHIDPAVLQEDGDTVGALVLAALNAANDKKEATASEKVKGIASKLLPTGFNFADLF
jgi:DNA-binding YbaB/EbfC family protein